MAAKGAWRHLQPTMNMIVFLSFLLGVAYGTGNPFSDCLPGNGAEKKCVVFSTKEQNHVVHVSAKPGGVERLMTFCYPGRERQWHHIWMNPRLILLRNKTEHMVFVYSGSNLTEVQEHHTSQLAHLWSYIMLGNTFSFHPFNASCLGLASTHPYTVDFKIRNPDPWLIAYVVIGAVLFFSARKWSKSVTLHYTSGVTLGVLASILIVVFIVTRMLPQKLKSLAAAAMVVSSSVSLFLGYYIGQNLSEFIREHWQLTLGYLTVTGLISFALVYRYGPITDARSLHLVQWAIQGVGLLCLFHGFQIPEVSIAFIVLVLTIYNFPRSIFNYFSFLRWRLRLFIPKRRLLTEEEYYRQGEVETERALEELRQFCQSPDCNAWKVVSRLKSPSRFASFVEDNSHLSDEEVSQHERYGDMIPLRTDDPDESELDFRLGNYPD